MGILPMPSTFLKSYLSATCEALRLLITQYVVLEGNPGDDQQVEPSLERHKETFGHAPELYGSDRGFFSEKNVKSCKQKGVKVVCIPQRGGQKTPTRAKYEKSPDFKRDSAFEPASRGASPCCSAVVA